jgi:hypothetical protein
MKFQIRLKQVSPREHPQLLHLAQKERMFWTLPPSESDPNELDHTTDPKCPSLNIPSPDPSIWEEQFL